MTVNAVCDHCMRPLTDIVYVLCAVSAATVDLNNPVTGPCHLHWECVPLFGRSKTVGRSGMDPGD